MNQQGVDPRNLGEVHSEDAIVLGSKVIAGSVSVHLRRRGLLGAGQRLLFGIGLGGKSSEVLLHFIVAICDELAVIPPPGASALARWPSPRGTPALDELPGARSRERLGKPCAAGEEKAVEARSTPDRLAEDRVSGYADFFCLAQRFRCAAAIFARASAESTRFFRVVLLGEADAEGRPLRFAPDKPAKAFRAS
jgi:hypothetical protein